MSKQTKKHLISLIQREYRNDVRRFKRVYRKDDPLLQTVIRNARAIYQHSKNAIEHASIDMVPHLIAHSRNYRVYNYT